MSDSVTQIVGIGASAGGLEAIKDFFKHVNVDSGYSYVVIQHLSPEYKSMMSELLGNQTDIPVQVAEQGMEPKPDHIYLIPPSKNLRLKAGKLQLESQDRSSDKVNLPIDLFFASLADELGDKAVGVVLSGTGSDGTMGARKLKESGSLVIAQKPDTARFDGMPKSIVNNNLADYVLDIEEMGHVISEYFKHPALRMSQTLEEQAGDSGQLMEPLGQIFGAIKARFKTDFSVYKTATVTRRIQRRISITRSADLAEYSDLVARDSEEQRSLFNEILIGVTSFYRNGEVFDALFEKYLREYLRERRNQEIRIWVPGCSTGEEAYTITMIALEICAQESINADIKVFATDIDQQALAKASNGTYSESIATDLPGELLVKYMKKNADHYTVSRQVRERVVFARHDVISDPPFTRIDLISCRNMLIYLQQEIQNQVLHAFNFSLKAKGLLLLGNSESLGDSQTYFKTLHSKYKLFESIGLNQRTSITSQRLRSPSTGSSSIPQMYSSLPTGSAERRASEELKVIDNALDALTPNHLGFTVIVNQESEVLRIIGDSSRYMTSITGRPNFEIGKMLTQDLSIPVMSGLSRVFRTGKEASYSNVVVRNKSETMKVAINIVPVTMGSGHASFAAVVISEVKQKGQSSEAAEYDVELESINRINELEQELQFSRENLQATIEELETSNEELQATNEELLASNEELQSTNEELQSVNEELYTVNYEYQSKLEEMNTLNSDNDMLLKAMEMAVVYLDEQLRVRRFTSLATRIFNIIMHDVGRPFEHISNQIIDWDIQKAVKTVLINQEPIEQVVEVTMHGQYTIRISPLDREDGRGGVMIVMTGSINGEEA